MKNGKAPTREQKKIMKAQYSCVKKYDIKTFDKKLNKLLSR